MRKIYGQYTKKHLEQDNEVVVLLPYYKTVQSVLDFLRLQHGIDVQRYGASGFLMIADAYKRYMGFQDRDMFFRRLISHAAMSGKAGVSFMMDMGMTSMLRDIERQAASYRHMCQKNKSSESRHISRTTRRTMTNYPRSRSQSGSLTITKA